MISLSGSDLFSKALRTLHRNTTSTPKHLRGLIYKNEGSVLIEAAFIIPAFAFLLFGIFEFSLAMTSYCGAAYAVRLGARYASVHSATCLAPATSTAVKNIVTSSLFTPGVTSPAVTVGYTNYYAATSGNLIGNTADVAITWSQAINLPGYHHTFSVASTAHRMIIR